MARPRKFERDTLLQKALEVFWEKGYEATSVQDLCAQLAIHPGSLFGTFGDKRTLFYEALTRYEEQIRDRLFAIFEEPIAQREILEKFFAATITFLLESRAAGQRGCFMVNSFVELCPLDPYMDQRAIVNLARLEARFLTLLQVAVANNEIRSHSVEELQARARSLMANTLSLRLLARVGSAPEVLHDVARVALCIFDY